MTRIRRLRLRLLFEPQMSQMNADTGLSETCVFLKNRPRKLCGEHVVIFHPVFGELCWKHMKMLRGEGHKGFKRISSIKYLEENDEYRRL